MSSERSSTSTELPPDRSAPRRARTWVSAQLNPLGLGRTVHDAIVLLVSELVTNVVIETETAPVVTLTTEDGRIIVEVDDPQGAIARMLRPAPDELEGWGLKLVEELADSWGVRRRADGTGTAWFSLADPAAPA
jgi:anti-sigma regulatory factor (Ser/Thr protein kinase)